MDISVIIPFYNSGKYIGEAMDSLLAYHGSIVYEIIIIDDGSDDEESLAQLERIQQLHTVTVLHQENKGATAVRNAGCRIAKGAFLFFLDSDNIMRETYGDAAMAVFRDNPAMGVVYCQPDFFGDASRSGFVTGPFDVDKILMGNYIDMCALVRREAWESVGGFDENPSLNRLQDWEFWISLYKKGWQFECLSETHFDYRIRKDSIGGLGVLTQDDTPEWYDRRKHVDLLRERFAYLWEESNNSHQKIENLQRELEQQKELWEILRKPILFRWYIKVWNLFRRKKIPLK